MLYLKLGLRTTASAETPGPSWFRSLPPVHPKGTQASRDLLGVLGPRGLLLVGQNISPWRPKPPQLVPLHVQRLYSEFPPQGDPAPHPVTLRVTQPPYGGNSFHRLCLRSPAFAHDPKLLTVDEGKNGDGLVGRELCLSFCSFFTTATATATALLQIPPVRLSISRSIYQFFTCPAVAAFKAAFWDPRSCFIFINLSTMRRCRYKGQQI